MTVTMQVAGSLAEAGPEWDALLAGPSFQSTRPWFEAMVEAALPPGARAEFWMVRDPVSDPVPNPVSDPLSDPLSDMARGPVRGVARVGGRPLLLLPVLVGPGGRVGGLTTLYTTQFQPLAAPDAPPGALRAAGRAVGRRLRAWPRATLEALDPGWPGLPPFLSGLRASGLAVRRFDHFGNWHQPVGTWDGYLAARPGPLRETIRRKSRACARDPEVRIEVVRGGDALAPAMAAYEDVYARSWKQPEPSPGLSAALLPRAAQAGALRLGVMWSGRQAVAAQYWTVSGGVAAVLKLAHDDAWRALSPGTVLTAHMIRLLIGEGASELDFGRGDDPYKQLWAGQRRQRVGVLAAAPWRPRGVTALLQHDAGSVLRWARRLGRSAEL